MTNARPSRNYLIADQFSAVVVDSINKERVLNELLAQSAQDQAFNKAIEQINKIRAFVGSPDRILGSELTKHGEIAEQVEVGIRNAKSALQQQNLTATFEGVGRTAPADYLIDGISVQSKFINGLSNNLDRVIEHMDKYANFGRDGSYYHIPKDSHETILKILNGESVEGLSQKTINALTQKVQEIEQKAGQAFTEVVKPGLSNYVEVQQGNITSTLEKHQKNKAMADRSSLLYSSPEPHWLPPNPCRTLILTGLRKLCAMVCPYTQSSMTDREVRHSTTLESGDRGYHHRCLEVRSCV